MSLEAIDIQLNEGFYYQDKEVSGISLIEYDSEMDYNYKFVYSDNDAGHILFENLGGWKEYKEAMTKYTSSISDNYFQRTMFQLLIQ